MKYLYDVKEINQILQTKKKFIILMIVFGVVTIIVDTLSFIFINNYLAVAINILITSLCLGYVYTYFSFFRKELNEKYHFLAKIDNYDHQLLQTKIIRITKENYTISEMIAYQVELENNQVIYIEKSKYDDKIEINKDIKLETVDNFIVGYEVI